MNPFVNLKKRSVSLPSGCKDLIDVLHRPKRATKPDQAHTKAVRQFIHLILLQAQQDHATVVVIGAAPDQRAIPLQYLIEGTWYDMAPFPPQVRPAMMTELARMAHLPVGQFPSQGVLDETFGEVRLRWLVAMTGLDHDCFLTCL
jgi:type II secretory ATPase GspE/PulE/Tfp pilus assembly ATPase PilB-like protein